MVQCSSLNSLTVKWKFEGILISIDKPAEVYIVRDEPAEVYIVCCVDVACQTAEAGTAAAAAAAATYASWIVLTDSQLLEFTSEHGSHE